MASIKAPMLDIMTSLSQMPIVNNDNTDTTPYVRVWNNQLKYDEEGKMEAFPKPAYFLEIISPVRYEVIGQGYRSADIGVRIHIVHEYYNSIEGGTFAQDLDVIDLKDQVVALLTYMTPTGCGPLVSESEEQDTDHNNLYHFILDFSCNFTDSKGSRLDEGRTVYINKPAPTGIEIDTTVDKTEGGEINKQPFKIPQTFK